MINQCRFASLVFELRYSVLFSKLTGSQVDATPVGDSNSVLAADSIESIGTCIHAHPWCGCTQPLTRRVAGFSQRVRFDDTCVGQMVIDSNDGSACDYCVEWVAMNRSVWYYYKNGYIKDKCTGTAPVDSP